MDHSICNRYEYILTYIFNSYYCNVDNKAFPISELIEELEKNGNDKATPIIEENA